MPHKLLCTKKKKQPKLYKTCQAYFPENGPVMIIKKSVRSKLSEKTFAFE